MDKIIGFFSSHSTQLVALISLVWTIIQEVRHQVVNSQTPTATPVDPPKQ